MPWMPTGSACEAAVGHPLAITTDVVDPAGERERGEKRAGCVGDVDGGAELGHRPLMSGPRPVQEPEPKNDATASGAPREPVGLVLGRQHGSQDRRDIAKRRVFNRPRGPPRGSS
jgi:hypothetical protein